MNKMSLNGKWNYRIGKGAWEQIVVPFSKVPVGYFECEKTFDLPSGAKKFFLTFDGITYYAKVFLNGKFVGEMQPYCEYKFDVTDTVTKTGNLLSVQIQDIEPEFGPSAGWCNYSGIIRDVYLEYCDGGYINDVFFYCDLTNNYKSANYVVELDVLNTSQDSKIEVLLKNGQCVIDSHLIDATQKVINGNVNNVLLWSPDEPNLYQLYVKLINKDGVVDEYSCSVGFREFKTNRHRFLLNGKELFLQGVCKHEIVGDYGHVVPIDVIERELIRIKQTGCNYVRLVHYPHCKQTLDIADKIGIMVSEEPGLWWSDTSNPKISAGSLEVLKRTILRDRNHPSIVFWLSFNECLFTEQFLIDSVNVCRKYDPTRLVSGANCMSDEDTLKYYNICGFDFYTMHPYYATMERALRSAEILYDKPLLFTEWGGYFVYDNPHLISDFIKEMYAMYLSNADKKALAGACFWYWAEVEDFNRGKPACINGVLKEALVDKFGNKTSIYDAFCNAWKEAKITENIEDEYEFNLIGNVNYSKSAVCVAKTDVASLLESVNARRYNHLESMRYRIIKVGPILKENEQGIISKIPNVLKDFESLQFEVDGCSNQITIIGAVSLIKGFPLGGEYGESACVMQIECDDGEIIKYELLNGVHFTTALTTIASSRINPVCEKATVYAKFNYEKNFENYIINKLTFNLLSEKHIKKITFNSLNKGYELLFYSVFI